MTRFFLQNALPLVAGVLSLSLMASQSLAQSAAPAVSKSVKKHAPAPQSKKAPELIEIALKIGNRSARTDRIAQILSTHANGLGIKAANADAIAELIVLTGSRHSVMQIRETQVQVEYQLKLIEEAIQSSDPFDVADAIYAAAGMPDMDHDDHEVVTRVAQSLKAASPIPLMAQNFANVIEQALSATASSSQGPSLPMRMSQEIEQLLQQNTDHQALSAELVAENRP